MGKVASHMAVKAHGNPCSLHQNSLDLWMSVYPAMVFVGIDPSPYHIT